MLTNYGYTNKVNGGTLGANNKIRSSWMCVKLYLTEIKNVASGLVI